MWLATERVDTCQNNYQNWRRDVIEWLVLQSDFAAQKISSLSVLLFCTKCDEKWNRFNLWRPWGVLPFLLGSRVVQWSRLSYTQCSMRFFISQSVGDIIGLDGDGQKLKATTDVPRKNCSIFYETAQFYKNDLSIRAMKPSGPRKTAQCIIFCSCDTQMYLRANLEKMAPDLIEERLRSTMKATKCYSDVSAMVPGTLRGEVWQRFKKFELAFTSLQAKRVWHI